MLSQSQIDSFHNDGYLIIDLNSDPQLFDQIVADTLPVYPAPENGVYHHGTRVQDAWKFSNSAKQLAMHPLVLDALESIYLRRPLPFQTLNFPIGTQQPMHSDTIHFNSFPRNFMVGVWVALEDVDTDNGPVEYCRGSHLLPEYNMQDVGKGITYENYKHYEAFIAELVKARQYEPVPATMKKGQAFIWHGNLLHGGSYHKDKSRSRHSQVTHYYFEGCSYYTPMMSTPDNIFWREPEWIGNFEPKKATSSFLTRWRHGLAWYISRFTG